MDINSGVATILVGPDLRGGSDLTGAYVYCGHD